jgi:ribonuclease BN (tRNA processing enzyme)
MRLTVVGCAGSVAGPHNPASCYVLEADGEGRTWRLVLDLGSGAFGPLQTVVDPVTIDGILISHGHLDHCADLAALSVLLRYGPARDTDMDPIPLWGPDGIDERVRQVEGSTDDAGLASFAWSPLAAGESRQLGPFTVTAAQAFHPVPALAYRIQGPSVSGGDSTLVFTGDTAMCEEVVELARAADVLLAEAGWAHRLDNPPGVHLTGAEAGQLAAQAGAERLIVTHVASWVDPTETLAQARAGHANTVLAAPGVVFEV